MTGLEILVALIFMPILFCVPIALIGFFSTQKYRYDHEEKMFDRREQAKRNAIDIDIDRASLVGKQMRALGSDQW